MIDTILLLGSNIDPLNNIKKTLAKLRKFKIVSLSNIYISSPYGKEFEGQPDFLNLALRVYHTLEIENFYKSLKSIEKDLGRKDQNKGLPRVIDIDIAFYGNFIGEILGHKIPDPNFGKADFATVPIIEVAPEFIHPISKKPLHFYTSKKYTTLSLFLKKELLEY